MKLHSIMEKCRLFGGLSCVSVRDENVRLQGKIKCTYGVGRKVNWACFTVTCSARPIFFFLRIAQFTGKAVYCVCCVRHAYMDWIGLA